MAADSCLKWLQWDRTLRQGAAKQVVWAARRGWRTNPLFHLAHLSVAGFGRTTFEMKSATSIVRDRSNWVVKVGVLLATVCNRKHVQMRGGYSLHLILIHQSPTNGVLATEVVNPPLGNVRNGNNRRKVTGLTVHVLSAKDVTCKHEGSLRVRALTPPKASNLVVCPGVGQSLSAYLNASCQRGVTPVGSNGPSSNDCLAIPREASLPAKLAYIPS